MQIIEITDSEFVSQFENTTLNKIHFNHKGHLRLAWIYLNAYPFDKALELICLGIEKYAMSLGANDKFNVTITQALMHIMKLRLDQNWLQDFQAFANANEDLFLDSFTVLTQYYSKNILYSDLAKSTFVSPDKCKF